MRTVVVALCLISMGPLFAVSTPLAAAAEGPSFDRGERAIVRAVNRIRTRHGLPGVRRNVGLAAAADAHSAEMLATGTFGHGEIGPRVRAYANFHRIGETLAWSPRCSAGKIVRMWMHSTPHRTVLLRRGYRNVGVGRRAGWLGYSPICMVTADFGTRR
jgi:uncharacterized protein YkwD